MVLITASGESVIIKFTALFNILKITISDFACCLGLSPMSTELLPFETADDFTVGRSEELQLLQNGQTCFVTVRCYNKVGLSAVRTSKGIPYVGESPDSSSALVALDANTDSPYGHRGNYQSHNNSVSFHWAGFQDETGISHYQVKMESTKASVIDWFSVVHQKRAIISGIALQSGHQYTIAVRAVNYGGLTSHTAALNFTVANQYPTATGEQSIDRQT